MLFIGGHQMRYIFKSLVIVLIVFPVVTVLLCGIFMFSQLSRTDSDILFSFLIFSLITGFCLGIYHARKSGLPNNFAARYWPLLTPMVLILVVRIFINISGYDVPFLNIFSAYSEPSFFVDERIIKLALCFMSFIVSFTAFVPSKLKLSNTRWRWQTCVFVVMLFLLLVWQVQVKQERYITEPYEGVTVSDEAIINWHWPWSETDKLPKLDTPASLFIKGSYPTIDGSTSFVPIYSAVVNEIYQVDDKNELKNYITCSKSAGA